MSNNIQNVDSTIDDLYVQMTKPTNRFVEQMDILIKALISCYLLNDNNIFKLHIFPNEGEIDNEKVNSFLNQYFSLEEIQLLIILLDFDNMFHNYEFENGNMNFMEWFKEDKINLPENLKEFVRDHKIVEKLSSLKSNVKTTELRNLIHSQGDLLKNGKICITQKGENGALELKIHYKYEIGDSDKLPICKFDSKRGFTIEYNDISMEFYFDKCYRVKYGDSIILEGEVCNEEPNNSNSCQDFNSIYLPYNPDICLDIKYFLSKMINMKESRTLDQETLIIFEQFLNEFNRLHNTISLPQYTPSPHDTAMYNAIQALMQQREKIVSDKETINTQRNNIDGLKDRVKKLNGIICALHDLITQLDNIYLSYRAKRILFGNNEKKSHSAEDDQQQQ